MCKQWSCYWHDKDNFVKVAPHKLKMVLPTLTWTFYYTLDQILCTKREKSIGKERKKGSIYLSIQKWKPAHSIQLPSIYIQGSIFTFSQSHQPGSKPHGIHTCSLVTIWVARTKVQNCIYKECVVPENIQTPTTEGISLRTPPLPPPPWICHFCGEMMTPHPSGISTSVTKTPQPLWKVHFNEERLLK